MDPTSRMARIRLDLSEFNFDIEYVPGKTNVVADALSRVPIESLRDNYVKQYEVLSSFAVYVVTRSGSKKEKQKTDQVTSDGPDSQTMTHFPILPYCYRTEDSNLLKNVKYELKFEFNDGQVTVKLLDKRVVALGIVVPLARGTKENETPRNIDEKNMNAMPSNDYTMPRNEDVCENDSASTRDSPHIIRAVRDRSPLHQYTVQYEINDKINENEGMMMMKDEISKNKGMMITSKDLETLINAIRRVIEYAISRNAKDLKLNSNDELFTRINVDEFVKTMDNDLRTTAQVDNHEFSLLIFDNPVFVEDVKKRETLIEHFHNHPLLGGHCCPARLYAKLKSRYTWPGMRKEVFRYSGNCPKCQMNKAHARFKHPFEITDTPARAFDMVEIDTVGPLTTSKGFKYVLTMQCCLTKYVFATPIVDKSARTIARAFFDEILYLHGLPRCILSDNGLEYNNQVLRELNSILNIEHRFSSPYRPQTIGGLERNHRVLNAYFRTYMKDLARLGEVLRVFVEYYTKSPS